MEYVCTQVRFRFWNGRDIYTVAFLYGMSTWFVFKDDTDQDALYKEKINPVKSKSPNRESAEDILCTYLNNNPK